MPNIHPLVDKLYKPYDIGQVGQLDLRILAEIYSGESASNDLTPAWDGGIYWAGQLRSANTPAEQASTGSIALFYLSAWKNEASAQAFAKLYANNLGRKYSGLKPNPVVSAGNSNGDIEQVFSTDEGPVVITTRGKLVFTAESFDLDLARKLTALILDAQGTGELQQAQTGQPGAVRITGAPGPDSGTWESLPTETLTAGLIRFFSNCGVMKAAIDGEIKAATR
jgi:hypothetical protein